MLKLNNKTTKGSEQDIFSLEKRNYQVGTTQKIP
jgi:hypothetical protein